MRARCPPASALRRPPGPRCAPAHRIGSPPFSGRPSAVVPLLGLSTSSKLPSSQMVPAPPPSRLRPALRTGDTALTASPHGPGGDTRGGTSSAALRNAQTWRRLRHFWAVHLASGWRKLRPITRARNNSVTCLFGGLFQGQNRVTYENVDLANWLDSTQPRWLHRHGTTGNHQLRK